MGAQGVRVPCMAQTETIRAMKVLDPETIGQRRLEECALRGGYPLSFEPRELGVYSIRRQPVLVARVANVWALVPCTRENVRLYRGRAYLVKGRRVEHLVYRDPYENYGLTFRQIMDRYECEDTSRPLYRATTDEIFQAGKGQRTRKKCKNSYSREQAGTIGRVVTVKRFENSRLTCVCKSLMY